ncbi:hypothetical protein BU17DRAFT_49835 [Hysterangium stoloniferum]|nr:hypothetical protein BU17DRAFT_49835 [Hysterangium stoloniferum]
MSIHFNKLPFIPSLYSMDTRLAELFKSWTGIQNDEKLKHHVLRIQSAAYEKFPYPCIRLFMNYKMPITDLMSYDDMIALGKQNSKNILLDVGPAFGIELRQLVSDGYPVEDTIALELIPQLWDIGHELCRSNSSIFPVRVLEGDIFDDAQVSTSDISPTCPDLQSVSTLGPLTGHISVLLAFQLFHLFTKEKQVILARRFACLLSRTSGSLIAGRQTGSLVPRHMTVGGQLLFFHSPESWEEMWSDIFPEGTVEYTTVLKPLPSDITSETLDLVKTSVFLTWTIKVI